ncbi:tRNA pseudouridine(38-40) synthase TruA [Nakamurella flava]|uniref:tRNA pseudouridine synthase A n=1 Tax=Nakamurella flava TaxID=2576308 RepID=A0A4U6QEP8_9ACTN|nr:tRNA pseudouridine synthase A [Nakamurella flava]TKV58714.1 tRNA pseudouridine(38-40) synthase TruA [Nakamurella flava]
MPYDEPTARSLPETGPSAFSAHPRTAPAVGDPVTPLRLRLDISYQGTDFVGWAEQPGRRTVAGELQGALATLLRTPGRLVVAGRTDSGVHATGQVAHVDVDPSALLGLTPRDRAPAHLAGALVGLVRRLAGLLPGDVRVRAAAPAPDGFDARFSALRRHYRYRIGTADWGVEPADRAFVLAVRRELDVDAMAAAGVRLLGLHDFAAYCKPRDGATTIRELQSLVVRRAPLDPAEVVVEVSADAFCHSMVRSVVGALLAVGLGRDDVDGPRRRLVLADRTAFPVAAAHGLTLVGVDYPAVGELSVRAERTRAVRTVVAGE